ncbi:type VI secretion system lipoprotein TssJ [Aquicoccus sp. G2-2]|uniref:type VI secretion system lipoprotein TssJ n=1 Tax=Aquicoccus sp. G2-2 TaxID=3092120 RepID=UPI002AE0496D|nr:type VI secretion system lipoprotein TssJ [Aquicoccus sp. G2-2]MEA1114683.1 type VI secretion system lipoprotein TssJ [Aquicoccus sp. G2-2]
MTFDRRTFLVSGSAGLALAGCMGPSSNNLAVSIQGRAGMNPGPDGKDRPVTVSILQMSGSSGFDSADYVSLQSPSSALGAELLKADQIVISGTTPVSRVIPVQAGASVIGIVGGFRSPTGKIVRRKIAAPTKDSGLIINVGPGGISVSTA